MADFDLIGSTVRGGVTIDEIEIEVPGAPPATAYRLGRRLNGPQPVAIGLHDERGDKASMLPDLEHLAGRGFLCFSIDSPITRRASADRDPLQAFERQFAIAAAMLAQIASDPGVHDNRIALLGRGIGGEVAAALAASHEQVRVVVAMAALPDRSDFVRNSTHPLAAGLRQFTTHDELNRQIDLLEPRRLLTQLEISPHTHWLLQVPQDDDRLSDNDHTIMSLSIPRTVRVDYITHARDLNSVQARRNRIDFISSLCG